MTSDADPDATPWSSPSELGFDLRERARLFDGEAERYDRSRPDYPDALIDAVLTGRLDPRPSIGMVVGLDGVPDAIELARRAQGPPRIVVHPYE